MPSRVRCVVVGGCMVALGGVPLGGARAWAGGPQGGDGMPLTEVAGTQAPEAASGGEVRVEHERSRWHVGVRVGGRYDLLPRPRDPRGEPTLLGGSAFDGLGWGAGVAGGLRLVEFGAGFGLGLELDLLYAHLQGDGFIRDPQTNRSQTVTFKTGQIHLPLLLRLEQSVTPRVGWFVGLGPQLFVGLWSEAEVETQGVGEAPRGVETTAVAHLGVGAGVGVAFEFERWRIPLEFRFGWDPTMPDSTKGRFEGYTSLQDPGVFQVGFTWQSGVMVGIDVPL